MNLLELHGYKKYTELTGNDVIKKLEKQGLKFAKGGWGVVAIPSGKDYVYRFWTQDSGYESYLEFMEGKNSKHFPKLLSKVKKLPMIYKRENLTQDWLKVVKIEKLIRLDKNERDLIDFASDTFKHKMHRINDFQTFISVAETSLEGYFAKQKMKPAWEMFLKQIEFWKIYLELGKFLAKHPRASFDVHEENVMKRADGTWVITDPAYGTQKPIRYTDDTLFGGDVSGRKEKLKEAFDSSTSYKIVTSNAKNLKATVEINGRQIEYSAFLVKEDRTGSVWEMEFSQKTETGKTYAATGAGGELKVFSLLKKFTQEIIDRHAPSQIDFVATKEKDSRRANLYHTMFERWNFKNYYLTRDSSRHQSDYFSLIRDV